MTDGRFQASWCEGPHNIRRIYSSKTEAKLERSAALVAKAEGRSRYLNRPKPGEDITFEKAVEKFLEWSEKSTRAGTFKNDKMNAPLWLASPCFAGKKLSEIKGADVEQFRLDRLKQTDRRGPELPGLVFKAAALHKAKAGKWPKGKRRDFMRQSLEALLKGYPSARILDALGWWYGGKPGPVDLQALPSALGDWLKATEKANTKRLLTKRTADISLARLKRMFNRCVELELCDRNPAAKIKLFRDDVKRTRYLSEEEEARLMNVCSPALQRVVQFAIHTGMRRGEILGLRWQDVDTRNTVAIIPGTTAKGKRDRFVPLNEVALAILKELPQNIDRAALCFGNSEGGIWDRLRKEWPAAVLLAGLEDFRFHDLRHTYASRLVMAGCDLAVLRELLGHRDFAMTLRYAHLAPSRMKEAVSLLIRKPGGDQTNIKLTSVAK